MSWLVRRLRAVFRVTAWQQAQAHEQEKRTGEQEEELRRLRAQLRALGLRRPDDR